MTYLMTPLHSLVDGFMIFFSFIEKAIAIRKVLLEGTATSYVESNV